MLLLPGTTVIAIIIGMVCSVLALVRSVQQCNLVHGHGSRRLQSFLCLGFLSWLPCLIRYSFLWCIACMQRGVCSNQYMSKYAMIGGRSLETAAWHYALL